MGLAQVTFEGKNKIEVAIERIKLFQPPNGYFLAFSGGKDSIVIEDLTRKSGVPFDTHYNRIPNLKGQNAGFSLRKLFGEGLNYTGGLREQTVSLAKRVG